MKVSRLSALVVLLVGGCMAVPKTAIQFDPKTHLITVQSPKDVKIEDFKLSFNTNGAVDVMWKSYSSHNNFEGLAALAKQNAATMKALAEEGAKLIGEASGAVKP